MQFGRVLLCLFAVWFLATPGEARPRINDAKYRYQFEDLSRPARTTPPGVLNLAAGPDTVYFGGTTWNAVAGRWEALADSCWTFDSGVGSNYDHSNPDLNPFKDTSLHALMEGWVGIDLDYAPNQYFRRLDSSLFGPGPANCPLNGNYSFWAGVLQEEADTLCFVAGQGYGNDWDICIQQTFNYNGVDSVTVSYLYDNESELEFDFTYVYVDTTGNDDLVTVALYNGTVSGTETLGLHPGLSLPSQAGPFTIKFCVESDEAFSDEDGDFASQCGLFTVDDISISGGGISYFTDFETDDGGWVATEAPAGLGGDWSNIVHLRDLPSPLVDCVCTLKDSVLVFEDPNTPGHNLYQNNIAASPWIDLQAAGVVGAPEKWIESDLYVDLPLLNYLYVQVFTKWYPWVCPTSGITMESPWTIDGVTHYFGVPQCTIEGGEPFRSDFSSIIDLGAERVRIGLGVFSACRFFLNCTGVSNSSPWFDNVKFVVCGDFGGGGTPTPVLSAREIDLPQDAFPEDGTLQIASPGRVDSGVITGGVEPGPFTSLGDTLTVQGGSGGAEVWVQFAVRPGPGVDAGNLAAFLGTVAFQESKGGLDWYAARMDTAENGGVPDPGTWMTAFHEADPAFSGSDTDIDPGDQGPGGGTTRLANDIFPDDLFTAGTRLNLFYKTKFTAGAEWFTLPDTAGGSYLEMEVLPSSMDSTGAFNCVLYVDHFDRDNAQELIEGGLAAVIPGGSSNFENTAWDRYDVRAASSHQATFGRPGNTEYGATVGQTLGYRSIIWNSGNLSSVNLVEEDAAILTVWLTALDPGSNNLYLSGDGIASSMTAEAATDPASRSLLENVLGVRQQCGTFRDAGCPTGSPLDTTTCVNIDPVGGAVVSTRPLGGTPLGKGNGCPVNRSFDVLSVNANSPFGTPNGEERYSTAGKNADFASVASQNLSSSLFRSVVDGISLHYRQEEGYCYGASDGTRSVQERLDEVLTWFGYSGAIPSCLEPGVSIGINDPTPAFRTALTRFSPNPLPAGRAQGQIHFSLAEDGPARIIIYDLQGRMIKTVLDGPATKGPQTVSWDGTDASGKAVASGVYFYSLRADGQEFGKKLVVVR